MRDVPFPNKQRLSYDLVRKDRDTVVIAFLYEDCKPLFVEYEQMTMETICQLVKETNTLHLCNRYIENFDYREILARCGPKATLACVDARNAFFDGDVHFDRANIREALFQGAQFGDGTVCFQDAMLGDVKFDGVQLGAGSFVWDNVRVTGQIASFEHARFGKGGIRFAHIQFGKSRVRFERTQFGSGTLVFEHAQFGTGGISFDGATAHTVSFRNSEFFHDASLRFDHVQSLEIRSCIINGILDLKCDRTHPVVVERLSLKNTKNLGRIYLDWETNRVLQAILSFESDHNNRTVCLELSEQFAMLKENYHNLGEYESEDKSFVAYMRFRRKLMRSVWKRGWDVLVDFLGAYGTKPLRVFFSMLAVWAIFSAIFCLLAYTGQIQSSTTVVPWANGFYFSAVTFLTIGYGDLAPIGPLAKALCALEGFFGLFLMSYFTVTIVRKTLR